MKFIPGPAFSAASGSQGGTVFSRNRYGAYTRGRTIPTNPNTSFQQAVRADLANLSTAWSGLTAGQRLAWQEWANQNPVVDSLGQSQILSGNAAYIQLNARLLRDGQSTISTPPTVVAPDALATLSGTYDIGIGTFEVAFTPTPLGAGLELWFRHAVTNSAGITFVSNLLRFTGTSAAAQASPFDDQSIIEARFGTLVVGQTVHRWVSVFDTATGLLSVPRRISGPVVST